MTKQSKVATNPKSNVSLCSCIELKMPNNFNSRRTMSIGSNSEVDEQNCEQEHLVDSVARHVPDENVALYSLSPKKKYLYTVIQYTIHICTPASSLDHKDHIPLFPPTSSPFQGSASTTKPSVPIFPLQVRLHQHRCSHRGGRAAARHAALDDGGTVCVKRLSEARLELDLPWRRCAAVTASAMAAGRAMAAASAG